MDVGHLNNQLLNNRYRLVESFGERGGSVVWRAHDEVLGRPVTVKVLTGPPAADADRRRRWCSDMQAVAGLSHPNVADVYDCGETPEHHPFAVVEPLDAPTLAEVLAAGPLSAAAALRICAQVAAGLAAAHAAGVAHGDVTAANVVVTDGEAKLVDFAATADDGTPAGDVHAIGLLLLQWATGMSAQVRRLGARCLAEDPADRPAAAEVASVLAAAVDTAPGPHVDPAAVLAVPAAPAGPSEKFVGRVARTLVGAGFRASALPAGWSRRGAAWSDDLLDEFRERRQLRLAIALMAVAALLSASFLLGGTKGAPDVSAEVAPGALGTTEPGLPGEPDATASPDSDTGQSTDAGADQSQGSGPAPGDDGAATDAGRSISRAESRGGAAGAGPQGEVVQRGAAPATIRPTATQTSPTKAPTSAAPARPATTAPPQGVRVSTLGGVVVATCTGGRVTILDVLPAVGSTLLSVERGTTDSAGVEFNLAGIHLQLAVRCVGGVPVASVL